jgi:diguanylate cyclase (GGDEF)-like protein
VGQVIAARLRRGDVAGRCEGNEFVAILPATDTAAARAIAGDLQRGILACSIPEDPEARITARAGMATFPDDGADAEGLFRAARATVPGR